MITKRTRSKKMSSSGGVDRLSSLPDCILIDILSRLPITSAAATAVLSSRWPYLWPQITSLKLSSILFKGVYNSVECFIAITKVINKLTSPIIRSFTLHLDDPCLVYFPLDLWFQQIHHRRVEDICFRFVTREVAPLMFQVSSFMFQTPSLVTLELNIGIICIFPKHIFNDDTKPKFNLPNLKKLSIQVLPFECEFWGKLIESCPSLEDLSYMVTSSPNIINASVIFPDITSISILGQNLLRLNITVLHDHREKVVIDAPRLEYLMLNIESLLEFRFAKKPNALCEAMVSVARKPRIPPNGKDVITKFLGLISNVKSLTFDVRSYSLETPLLFPNLTHLRFMGCYGHEFKVLWPLLKSCTKLENLCISMSSEVSHGVFLIPPKVSPSCLLDHIKRIEIKVAMIFYDEEENLLKVLEYFLLKGLVLEHLICTFTKKIESSERSDVRRELLFWKKLSKCEIGSSRRCQIVFSGLRIKSSIIKHGNS